MNFKVSVLLIFLIVIGLGFSGCETMAEIISSPEFANSFANTSSALSDTGYVYTFTNRSSYEVKIMDSTGSLIIPSGYYQTIKYNATVSIYEVYYEPTALVNVKQEGFSFIFYNK